MMVNHYGSPMCGDNYGCRMIRVGTKLGPNILPKVIKLSKKK